MRPDRKYFSGDRILLKNKKTGEIRKIIVEYEHPDGTIQTKDMKFFSLKSGEYEPVRNETAALSGL